MNRLIASLAVLVLLFWSLFVYRLILRIPDSRNHQSSEISASHAATAQELLALLHPKAGTFKDVRDPFRAPEGRKTQPRKAAERTEDKAPPVVKEHPQISLDAVLPGDNPVAILKYHGESAVVKQGQAIWGVTVVSIDASKVILDYEGDDFELRP